MTMPTLAPIMAGAAAYWTLASPYSQLLGPFPYRLVTSEKVIALTFDDGPNEPYTSQLADLLAESDVLATFFQVGANVERAPEVARRLAEDGHLIGNHSWSHQIQHCVGQTVVRAETQRTNDLLTDVLGRTPTLYRPPWLLRTPAHFRIWKDLGLQPVSGLFCHPLEVFQPPAAVIAESAARLARPGAIIIFHDGFDARGGERRQTVAAVRLLIPRLRDAGYRFVTVDRLAA